VPHFFDTHIHLDHLPPDSLESALQTASDAGVAAFLVPGIAPEEWSRLLLCTRRRPGIFSAPGVHPYHAATWNDAASRRLEHLIAMPGVVAIGEIGLDGRCDVAQAVQEQAFRSQLRLAVAAGLPVIIHCRRATERLLRILDEEQAARVGGIFHSFSGSRETALEATRRNFAIGLGGPLTWPEARRLPELVRSLPREVLVLETDAPDLAPEPFRHETNQPRWLLLVAARLAELRGWSLEETAQLTTGNARRIFGLSEDLGRKGTRDA